MNRLHQALRRLHFAPETAATEGYVQAIVLGFTHAADWSHVAAFLHSVRQELEFPLPAVSIVGRGGYRLWFSLAEPVAAESARDFLGAACRTYLPDLPPARFECWPAAAGTATAMPAPPPARDETSGKWSAFIDPDLGSMFADEPGLEMAPSDERQADLLAGIASTRREVFARALARRAPQGVAATGVPPAMVLAATFADPKTFLLAVMNDPAASLDQRIEAAKALLPHFAPSACTTRHADPESP